MPTYIEILSVQRPFPFSVDEHNRTMFSCNYDCLAVGPVTSFEENIVSILSSAGHATLGTDTFIGPLSIIPAGAGPFTSIIDTGGQSPDEIHNGQRHERLSCQIIIRASSYTAARTRAQAIWRVLDGLRNVTI